MENIYFVEVYCNVVFLSCFYNYIKVFFFIGWWVFVYDVYNLFIEMFIVNV